MKTVRIVGLWLWVCFSLCRAATAAMWYVDAGIEVPGDGTSPGRAFRNVQDGIDAASGGDTVVVAEGTYLENVRFNGKNIVLRSTDPLNRDVVGNTILDGGGVGSVVTFFGAENETCVLSGFTIRNGSAQFGGGVVGGPPFRDGATRATIQNNVITENRGTRGGGLVFCDGIIRNNIVSLNSAGRGGAMRYCHGTIQNNIILANTATGEGAAGLDHCSGIIQNNVISLNSGLYSDSEGGLNGCDGIIQNNLISGNSSKGYAGGLWGCCGAILNNTIVMNSATGGEALAGGLVGCGGTIRNCVIWGNSGPAGAQLHDCSEPAYCCIQDWKGGGAGNTERDPLFADAAGGDYRLQAGSPCVDAGVNYYWVGWPLHDLDSNCRLAGERVDMGCYEHNSSPDSDGDLLSDAAEPAAGTDPSDDDTDQDSLRDGLEILRQTDPLTATPPGTIHVPADFLIIQMALCLAVSGDEIVVASGTYPGNLRFCGRDVLLRSSDPENPDIVASTILDGGGAGPVVSFTGSESKDCVLSGFTIRNGSAGYGGGIYGGPEQNPTHATIQNNTITGNSASIRGGGLSYCDGVVQNNTISGNYGGGLYWCNGIMQNNVICANSASDGGGLSECYGIIQNSSIVGNSARWDGGGLYDCFGTIVNCIIWGNTAGDGPQLYNCHAPTYSCVQGWFGAGGGNIGTDPRFVDAANCDFRLLPSSPCIDAGDNSGVGSEDTDIAGMHRIMYGGKSLTVDMGAYEYYINQITRDDGGLLLTWSSLSDKTYSAYCSEDMMTWQLAAENIPSMGDTVTTWLDPTAPLLSPDVRRRFYRLAEK